MVIADARAQYLELRLEAETVAADTSANKDDSISTPSVNSDEATEAESNSTNKVESPVSFRFILKKIIIKKS